MEEVSRASNPDAGVDRPRQTGPPSSAAAWLAALSLLTLFFHELGLPLDTVLGPLAQTADTALTVMLAVAGLVMLFMGTRAVLTPLAVVITLTAGADAISLVTDRLLSTGLVPAYTELNRIGWVGGLIAVLAALLVLMFRHDFTGKELGISLPDSGWFRPVAVTAITVFLLMLGWRATAVPGPLFPSPAPEQTGRFLLTLLVFPALSALVFELKFRALIDPVLDRTLGDAGALILQAVLFAVVFVQGFPAGIAGVAAGFVFGLAAGAARRSRGSVLVPMAMHWAGAILLTMFGWEHAAL